MPRLSPDELQKARVARKVEREAIAKQQQEEEEAMARKRQQEHEDAEKKKDRLKQLISAADALYAEINKLTLKGPAVPISQLSLDRVNKVIRSVKDFVSEDRDEFVDGIVEFVPAGDMPEYRDVTLVLSQVRAGLERFGQKRRKYWKDMGVDY